MNVRRKFEMELAGRKLSVETGVMAYQANGSCLVQYGETVVLATATMSKSAREGIDFFPLMVDYEEKLYAVGKIKGSRFIKREGRPTDEAVLTGRKIDRGLRPLFPQHMRNDVQVIVSVLSYDGENNPDVVGILAASAALHISDIPWAGPLAAMRVGMVNHGFILNPGEQEKEESSLDLVFSASADRVLMVDAESQEASEEHMYGAFKFGMGFTKQVVDFYDHIRSEVGKEKVTIPEPQHEVDGNVVDIAAIKAELKGFLVPLWQEHLFNVPRGTKGERKEKLAEVKDAAVQWLQEKYSEEIASIILKDFYAMAEEQVTEAILSDDLRIDGRNLFTIRELRAEVDLLPRTHGSALFSRGETQVLSTVTLGAPGDEQTLDGMEETGKKHYMHHYNFPPFSVGEVKPLRGASRRDIGHGALAEKALLPVLPSKHEFPYTIRVVSEIMGSNGSSSMASACGSSLALMAAGVPITRPVAGIAIGLASQGDRYKVITDIQDFEDGLGGMDFKVCGTTKGITAIQMDTKTDGLTLEIIEEALRQGKEARAEILNVIAGALPAPRTEMSPYAPRIITMSINPDKIRDVIGPGGKMINQIIDETGVSIDIEDDGSVFITAVDQDGGKRAEEWIKQITKEVQIDEIYDGKVVRIADFGAFIELFPGQDGLVHISELRHERVGKVEDVLKIGEIVKVKVIEIDNLGRVKLSVKALLPKPERSENDKQKSDNPHNKRGGNHSRKRNDRPKRKPNAAPATPKEKPAAEDSTPKKEKRGFFGRLKK